MTVEEEIRKHAKTTMQIVSLYAEWKAKFRSGATGNREDYVIARDSRKELEKPNWVPLDVVLGVLAKTEAQRVQEHNEFQNKAFVTIADVLQGKTCKGKIVDMGYWHDIPNITKQTLQVLRDKNVGGVRLVLEIDLMNEILNREKAEAERNQKLRLWFHTFLMIDWQSVGCLNDYGLEKWRKEKKEEFEALLGATKPSSAKASPRNEDENPCAERSYCDEQDPSGTVCKSYAECHSGQARIIQGICSHCGEDRDLDRETNLCSECSQGET